MWQKNADLEEFLRIVLFLYKDLIVKGVFNRLPDCFCTEAKKCGVAMLSETSFFDLLLDEIRQKIEAQCRKDAHGQKTALKIWAEDAPPDVQAHLKPGDGGYDIDGLITHFSQNFFALIGDAPYFSDLHDVLPDALEAVCHDCMGDREKEPVLVNGFAAFAAYIEAVYPRQIGAVLCTGLAYPALYPACLPVLPAYLERTQCDEASNAFPILVSRLLHTNDPGLVAAAKPYFQSALEHARQWRDNDVYAGLLHGWLEAGQDTDRIVAPLDAFPGADRADDASRGMDARERQVYALCCRAFVDLLNHPRFAGDAALQERGRQFAGLHIPPKSRTYDGDTGRSDDMGRTLLLAMGEKDGAPCFVLGHRYGFDRKQAFSLRVGGGDLLWDLAEADLLERYRAEIDGLLDRYRENNAGEPGIGDLVAETKILLEQAILLNVIRHSQSAEEGMSQDFAESSEGRDFRRKILAERAEALAKLRKGLGEEDFPSLEYER